MNDAYEANRRFLKSGWTEYARDLNAMLAALDEVGLGAECLPSLIAWDGHHRLQELFEALTDEVNSIGNMLGRIGDELEEMNCTMAIG